MHERGGQGQFSNRAADAEILARHDVSAEQIARHQLEQAASGPVDIFVASGPKIG